MIVGSPTDTEQEYVPYKGPGHLHPGQTRDAYGRFGGGSLDKIQKPPQESSVYISGNNFSQMGATQKSLAKAFETVLLAKVTEEVWGKIFDRAIEQAKEGDKDARKWLTDYYVGPPIQRASVDMQVRARTVVSEQIVTARDFIDGVIKSIEDVEENT